MRRSFNLLVLLIIAASLVSACSSTASSTATQSTPTPTTQPAPLSTVAQAILTQDANTNTDIHFNVGETAPTPDGYIVTVRKVYTSHGNDFETPAKGNQYLIVDVSVKNVTGQVQHMAEAQFTLIDSTGQRIDSTVVTLANVHLFIGGTLQDGSTMRGQLVYEVPTGNHPYQVTFQADTFSNIQTTWDIHS